MSREGEPNKETEEMRERVDNLRKTDNKYEDSVQELADNENGFRDELESAGARKESVGKLAEKFSTKDLERMEAEKEKWTDDLTGLRNKNAYNAEAPQLLSIEKRRENDCSLLIVDFDQFKDVNEMYGYGAGDDVLKKMSAILRKAVRFSDAVYRFGGEEFVIFLPATISSRAIKVAEKIRTKIEKSNVKTTDTKGKKVTLNRTVSVGCVGTDQFNDWSGYNPDMASEFLESMFKAANLSVKNSKEEGRNQVTLYSEDLLKK